MTPRTPIAAMLWELWRVTRAEIAWKLALPIGVAGAALLLGAAFAPAGDPAYQGFRDLLAAFALVVIVVPHLTGWLSVAKLNGGQPGFPFYLAYTRPVRTPVIVSLSMAYLTAVSSALYVVSAITLRAVSSHAFPLMPVVAWIAALTMIILAASWSTRNRALQMLVTTMAVMYGWAQSVERLTAVEIPNTFDWPPHLWPSLFDFPRSDYAWIALIGVASFGITIAMVRLQRCGAALPAVTFHAGAWNPGNDVWQWMVSLLRIACPTSSATRAQLWFDLKSNGLPVVTVGLTFALAIALLSAVSGPMDASINADPEVPCPIGECFYWRALPPLLAPMSLAVMLLLGGNAFGVRRRQGRTYLSAFEATQAYSTGHVAVLKLLVKSACVLAAIAAIGVSIWLSLPLLGDPVFIQMWGVPLSSQRSALDAAFAALTGYEQLALAIVATIAITAWVTSWGTLGALWARYPRRLNAAATLLVLYGLALALLALASWRGIGPGISLGAIVKATSWLAGSAIALATAYIFWSVLTERVLTLPAAGGVVLLTAVFGVAWATVLGTMGVSLADLPTPDALGMLSPALLLLTISVLAPWSYSRIRHT